MTANLLIDSREPTSVKKAFADIMLENEDLKAEVTALPTGDFLNDYFVVERKDIDDFISSFTQIGKRKTKEDYERLKQQTERLLEMKQPIKVVLIIGNDYEDVYSNVHPHSINGQIAKLVMLGLSVLMLPPSWEWEDLIYRLVRMGRKYGVAKDQTVLL